VIVLNPVYLYISIIVILICTIIIIYSTIYNKFQSYIIRINEAEGKIDNILRNKYDLLNRVIAIIKGNIKIEDEIFEEIVKLRSRKISNFDLDRKLVTATNEFLAIREKHKEELQSDEIKKIYKSLLDIDGTLTSLKEYYNENITAYNKLIRIFPTNIVAKVSKYKEKPFFDGKDMTDDIIDDFKL